MKTIKNIGIILLSVTMWFTATSCEDWLADDEGTIRTTEGYYDSPANAQYALNGIYGGLLNLAYYKWYMSDCRSDDVFCTPDDDSTYDSRDISSFNPNLYTIDTLNDCWEDMYALISSANLFLENVPDIEFDVDTTTTTVDVKSTFLAEARFLRALAYFELVRYFGHIPISTQSLTAAEAMTVPQSDEKEVYDRVIVPDLRYAVEHMQTSAYDYDGDEASVGRATLPAAKALLGRVYLTMAGYPLYETQHADSAAILLKEVIDYAEENSLYWAKTGSDWPHIWISDNDNKYHIFEIQYINQKNYGNTMVYWISSVRNSEYGNFYLSGGNNYPTTELKSLYSSSDVRYAATIDSSSKNWFTKFYEHAVKRVELGYSDIKDDISDRTCFPINYPLIRLEDVMLMYAEIVGPTVAATDLVNKIRTRAGLSSLAYGLDSSTFLTCVDEERRRELAGEGIRWHDIVRRNTFVDLIQKMFTQRAQENSTNYDTYINYVTQSAYIYPIPYTQMKACEGLYTQNEGYN